jgi:UDP-N-acetylmuramate--alanine ligase
VLVGQCASNVPDDCDLVVYSAAIREDNPELQAARARGLRVVKYSQLLGMLMASRSGIAVAGTHGKSTTTAMVAYVLRRSGRDPSFVIGAGVEQLGGGAGVGDGEQFVVEACEYDRSFHNLRPQFAAILNIEEDHLDYYSGLEEIVESFRAFGRLVPPDGALIVNGEDEHTLRATEGLKAPVETFGLERSFDWWPQETGVEQGCMRFQVWHRDQALAEVALSIPGRYNMANALAAFALCRHCGVDPETIAAALGEFRGAHRRLTRMGNVAGVTVVDDYAHHPREIQVTLRAARDYYHPRRLYVVFQPHQHSRTRFLLQDFAESFGAADVVIVPDIYFVRDSEAERELIAAQTLVDEIHARGREARYEPSFERIAAQLCAEVEPGDLVITMGAGDVWRVAHSLLGCLERTRQAGQSASDARAEAMAGGDL